MEFASVIFIWAFLPIVILTYYIAGLIRNREKRNSAQNGILIVSSLIFYMWGGIKQVLLLIALVVIDYGAGIWIDCFSGEEAVFQKSRKGTFLAALLLNIAILALFKYFNMVITFAEILLAPKISFRMFLISMCKFEGTGTIHARQFLMPLALSFIIFQSLSYLIDVYKKEIPAERNLLRYALYISFFAQMTQGPIMRYHDLGAQIREREQTAQRFASGIRRFCYGLGKKVIIANTIASVSDQIWNVEVTKLCTAEAWLGVILYTLQIYYDFSGYSDMAVGIGQLFGFDICENFNYPYTSLSIQEFWRRWHISLSTWFRDYIYFPLGGNRKGKQRTYFNLFIVFLVTGIWHGANLTFICWGLYFAGLSIAERLFLGDLLKRNPVKLLNWAYCIFAVMIGWALFRAPNLYHALKYYAVLFHYVPEPVGTSVISYFNADLFAAIIIGVLFSGLLQRLLLPVYAKVKGTIPVTVLSSLLQVAILVWSLLLVMGGSYNPSIYGAF